MTNSGSPKNDGRIHPLLPALKENANLAVPNTCGQWTAQPGAAFKNIADSLNFEATDRMGAINSVPSVWSRAVQLELAFKDRSYPTRQFLLDQWFGGLATLALMSFRRLPVEAKEIELDKIEAKNAQMLVNTLKRVTPSAERSLYELPPNRNPWHRIYIFFLRKKVFGLTCPTTLFVPSQNLQNLQAEFKQQMGWIDWNSGLFKNPTLNLSKAEKEAFRFWLEKLMEDLGRDAQDDGVEIVGSMIEAIEDFITKLGVAGESKKLDFVPNGQHSIELKGTLLSCLGRPVQPPKPEGVWSNTQMLDTINNAQVILVDEGIPKAWDVEPHDVMLYGHQSLGAFKESDIRALERNHQIICLRPEDIFLPELGVIINELEEDGDSTPIFAAECLQPRIRSQALMYKDNPILPILPLKQDFCQYFQASQLAEMVSYEQTNTGSNETIKVQVTLRLAGLDGRGKTYHLEQIYPLTDRNIIVGEREDLPILSMWPYLRSPGWKRYYVMAFMRHPQKTFTVETVSSNTILHPFKDKAGTSEGRLIQSETFPEYLRCLTKTRRDLEESSFDKDIGLILLRAPTEIPAQREWTVGVDFGTSFTNVYWSSGGSNYTKFLPNSELLKTLTQIPSLKGFELDRLRQYFLPQQFSPRKGGELPLATWLTVEVAQNVARNAETPILDGRIAAPNLFDAEPGDSNTKTNLKWEGDQFQHSRIFLKDLALLISAAAAKDGVSQIHWVLSYPTAFSRGRLNQYAIYWEKIGESFPELTGIRHDVKKLGDPKGFKTESLAIAEYFVKEEQKVFVNAVCVDIGGGTSDITIWENQKPIYQSSIKLAGRDIFSQFLERRPTIVKTLFQQYAPMARPYIWDTAKGSTFSALVDIYLQTYSDKLLDCQSNLLVDEDRDYTSLLTLMSIGVAGLYYYIGMLLKVLHLEGKYNIAEIAPVYLGGNGSRFLNWLTHTGRFTVHEEMNTLLSRMLALGSGFQDQGVNTTLSQHAKDEVAYGLVINDPRFAGWEQTEEGLIAGEDCVINGITIQANDRIILNEFQEDRITSFRIESLQPIAKFLSDFHHGLRDLNITLVEKLDDYKESEDVNENLGLWKEVERYRKDICQQLENVEVKNFSPEPPFIISLKALLTVLGERFKNKA